jgi:hypothetical protein
MARTLITLLVLLTAFSVNAQPSPNKPVRRVPTSAPLVLPSAPGEQLAAAATTYFGDYVCDFDQSLHVGPNARFDGYVDVRFGKQLHTMKPVLSQTGALRLEDVRGPLLLLQIPQKSMLFDGRTGRRLVDECVHEKQAENRRTMAAASPQPGLGVAPVGATDAAPASAPETAPASAPDAAPAASGASIAPAPAGR